MDQNVAQTTKTGTQVQETQESQFSDVPLDLSEAVCENDPNTMEMENQNTPTEAEDDPSASPPQELDNFTTPTDSPSKSATKVCENYAKDASKTEQNPDESILSDDSSITSTTHLDKVARLYEKYTRQCDELQRVSEQNDEYREQLLAKIRHCDQLDKQIATLKSDHENENSRLKRSCLEAENQSKIAKDRLAAQEQYFNKTVQQLKDNLGQQIEKLKSTAAQAQADKEAAVIKYATRESEVLTMQAERRRLNDVIQQITAERDSLNMKLKGTSDQEHQTKTNLEAKEGELSDLQCKVESLQSQLSKSNQTLSIASGEIEQLKRRLQQSREETDTIRNDYKAVFNQLQQAESKILEHQESFKAQINDLEALHNSESERHFAAAQLIAEMRPLVDESQSFIDRASASDALATSAIAERDTATCEAQVCRDKANELLALVKQLNGDCCELRAELERVNERLTVSENERTQCEQLSNEQKSTLQRLEASLAETENRAESETKPLQQRVISLQEKVNELESNVKERDTEMAITRKKHQAEIKELRSELTSMKRRLTVYESNPTSSGIGNLPMAPGAKRQSDASVKSANGSDFDGHSFHSQRASLMVDACDNVNSSSPPKSTQTEGGSGSISESFDKRESTGGASKIRSESGAVRRNGSNTASVDNTLSVHNQAMIEKICKLQKQLARRQEKIEFLEEHVRQILDECHKKQKIIQMYALREDAGTLSSPKMDVNKLAEVAEKAQLSKHNQTLMSSLFTGIMPNASDSRITLDVALEIGHKLQAVLEDALLKNIMLKENLETMGEEISRLSRENRSLKLASGGNE